MAITAQQVKQLREMTGAGMMDCKKALTEVDGDLDSAVEYLQKKGMAAAAKKAGRVAAEGLVAHWFNDAGTEAVMVEVNCETDFVARNEQFQEFVDTIVKTIGASKATTVDEVLQLDVNGVTVDAYTKDSILTIGENIQIRRFTRVAEPEGSVAGYLHAGAQIGVLVCVKGESGAANEFGRDIAMHIAAMNPTYLTPEDIDADERAKQEEIFAAIVKEEGKPEAIIPKIVAGKIGKWAREQSLMEQAFVKDSDLTVGQFQEKTGGVSIASFARFGVGDGIEKEETTLADEVAAMQG